MPTIISKDIGGGANDYASIAAWIAGAASTYPGGLVANDVVWKGNLYPGGGGSNGEWVVSQINVDGTTTCDATRYFWLAAASGQSFNNNAGKLTNALRYNPANGVAVRTNTNGDHLFLLTNNAVMRFTGLQLHNNQTADPRMALAANTGVVWVESCIVKGDSTGPIVYSVGSLNPSFINSIFYTGNASSRALLFGGGGSHSPNIRSCTFFGAGATSALQLTDNVQGTMKNTAVFGFSAVADDTSRMNGAACNNNATDLSSVGFGSSNQTSLTASSQFENVSSGTEDFRAKSGGAIIGNAAVDTTYATLDILGTTRNASTPTIGAFEPAATPQLAAPTSDITAGWTPSTGSTIYGVVDESVADDVDYAFTNVNATAEIKFASLIDPLSSSGHIVRYRVSVASGTTLTVSLRQGATLIKAWTHSGPVSLQTFEQTLSSGEADSITDYSDLRLRAVTS